LYGEKVTNNFSTKLAPIEEKLADFLKKIVHKSFILEGLSTQNKDLRKFVLAHQED
jgi:hypothetical protein